MELATAASRVVRPGSRLEHTAGPDGTGQIRHGRSLGTQENFLHYEILTALKRNAAGSRPARLGLFGYGNFQAQHETVHARLVELGMASRTVQAPARTHLGQRLDSRSGGVSRVNVAAIQ